MRQKGTLALFVFVLLLGGLTYYFEFVQVEQKEITKKESSKIFNLKKDQVELVRIQGAGNSPIIELKRSADGWNLIAPVQDLADTGEVESLLGDLDSEYYLDMVKEGVDIQWKIFGLDIPKGFIELKTTSGEKFSAKLASINNFENQTYLRRNEENKVLLVTAKWQSFIDKTLLSLRDKRLFRGRPVSIDQIEWKYTKESVVGHLGFVQKDAKWVANTDLLEKSDFRNRTAQFHFDEERLKKFLENIDDARATEFVYTGELKTDIRKRFGIAAKEIAQLSIVFKDNKWNGIFYRNAEKTNFVYVESIKTLLKLDSFAADKILKADWNFFRNHKDIFAIKEDIAAVSFESKAKKWKIENKNQKEWQIAMPPAENGNKTSLNQDKVKTLLNRLKELQADDFAGLDPKLKLENKLSIFNVKGDELLLLSWGESFKRKEAETEKSYYLVKSSQSDEKIIVEASLIEGLSIQDIFMSPTTLGKQNEKEKASPSGLPEMDQKASK